MKTVLKILFIIFLVWVLAGVYLLNTDHKDAQVVMGLAILFLSFILMPLFIYHRYKGGKYKKYIINDDILTKAFKDQGKR